MNNTISFVLDGRLVHITFDGSSPFTPTTTVLNYLRSLPGHTGVKEGCAEGDCGACTVVLAEMQPDGALGYKAVDSCLLFLPMLHGRQLITVENLKDASGGLHPVQQAMVDFHGSQCGFCTPGIVMSLFALYKSGSKPTGDEISKALAGNLCRCTGYQPILHAAGQACSGTGADKFTDEAPAVAQLLASIPKDGLTLIAGSQRYDQPSSVEACLAILEEFPSALVINGATDAALRVTKKFEVLPHVVDCSRIDELRKISDDGRSLTIGAGVSMADLLNAVQQDFPAFAEMLQVFAAEQIRNVATLGGNIGTASPIGDMLPVLMAYGASIVLRSSGGSRTVRADEFVKGYRKTERMPNELITSIILPKPSPSTKVRSYKISKRRDLDISTVSASCSVHLDARRIVTDIVLAYGGMAERTKRSSSAESFLKGKPWDRSRIEEAQKLIDRDFSPISDVRGSAEFRRVAAKNILMKFWHETVE